MRSLIGRTLGFLLVAGFCLPVLAQAHIFDVRKGKDVGYVQMIGDLQQVRLIFIGEIHDVAWHHQAQLQIIRSLHDAGVPLTIGLEMFRHDSQPALDQWVAKTTSEKEFLKVYEDNWSMWPAYREIFRYARQAGVPMIGLNITRTVTEQVVRTGFDSLSAEQRKAVPLVTCDVDPTYQNYMHRVLGKYPHGGVRFRNFCEAQMVWDAVMAKNLIEYLGRHPKKVVVVIAGNGHSWKFGIPEQVRRHLTIPFRVIIPEIPGRIELSNVSSDETDYLLVPNDDRSSH